MPNFFKYFDFFSKVIRANLKRLNDPYKIFLVVTKSCGSRCANCHIWKEVPSQEMTLKEYEQLSLKLGGTLSWLNISGGEPTDREDLIEIIKIFVKNCPNLLIVNFTSNGLNQKKLIEAAHYLSNSNVPIVGINVSIDGPPKTHEKLRGMPSSYEDAVSSLKELRSIKKIKVHASMTLFDQNSHLIEETLDALKANIVGFKRSQLHLNQAFHSEHYYKNSKNSVTLNSFLPHEVTKKFSLISSPTDFLKYIYLKNLARYQRTKITPIPCSSMTSNVYISEHGDLFTCTIWNKKVGSLREQDFNLSKLMTSPNARSLKSQIDKKMCVNCWSPCEAFPSIIDNIEYFIK